MRRRWRRWLPVAGMLMLLGVAGCKKNDDWGKDIETEAVDVNALREKAQQKKQGQGQAPPPAGQSQGQ